ncbi:MAG: sugar nucleotide-binding protein [Pleurocapsa sp. SU_196_0]|nr:sugar nucleotide-binding protein [Pleurocapsa sp. SU_196_0]
MKRIFVTGGRGRMGSELLPRLHTLGWHVTASSSQEVSILELSALNRALEPGFDVVLHLAAFTDAGLRVAAIGKGGVRELERHGIRDVIAPQRSFDSERLLARDRRAQLDLVHAALVRIGVAPAADLRIERHADVFARAPRVGHAHRGARGHRRQAGF